MNIMLSPSPSATREIGIRKAIALHNRNPLSILDRAFLISGGVPSSDFDWLAIQSNSAFTPREPARTDLWCKRADAFGVSCSTGFFSATCRPTMPRAAAN